MLPEEILIRRVRVHPFIGSASSANPMEIRIGNDMPTVADPFVNDYCAYFDGAPKDGQIIDLECPPPGIMGSVVTLHRINTDSGITVMEIEALGMLV